MRPQQPTRPTEDISQRWLRLAAFILGLILAGAGQYYCGRKQAIAAAIWYGAATLVTMLSLRGTRPPVRVQKAVRALVSGPTKPGAGWRMMRTALPILAVVVAAYPALYWRNTDMPPGPAHDEARSLLEALTFYTGSPRAWWAPGDNGSPGIYSAFNGLLFHCFSPTLGTFRSANATWTLLAAVVLFLYVRTFGGTLVGVLTAILFIHCTWVAHVSRWGFSLPWSMCGGMLAFAGIGWGLARSFEADKHNWRHPSRWGPYALAGFGAMLAQYGYISGRLILPALAATVLIACVIHRRHLSDIWPGLATLTAVAFITALPWVWALRLQPDLAFARAKGLSIQIDIHEANSLRPLWLNLAAHLRLFNYSGDASPQNNPPGWPLLHPLVAPAVAMGLVVALYYWRALVPAMPLLWFGILIWSGVLSRWVEAPKAHRIFTVAPVLFVALGGWIAQARLFLAAALRGVGSRVSAAVRLTGALLLVSWVCTDVDLEHRLYFGEYYRGKGLYDTFSPLEVLLNKKLHAETRMRTVLVFRDQTAALKAFTYFDSWVTFARIGSVTLRGALPPRGPVHVYVDPSYSGSLRTLARECGSEETVVKDPRSADRWWAEAVLPDAARAGQVLEQQPHLFGIEAAVAAP
jgi:hypothetical protein